MHICNYPQRYTFTTNATISHVLCYETGYSNPETNPTKPNQGNGNNWYCCYTNRFGNTAILRVYSSCFGSSGQHGRETLTGGPPIPSLTLLSLSCRRISLFSCFRRLLSMVDKIFDIPISDMFNLEFNDGNSLAGSRGLFVTTLKKYWLNFEMKNSYYEGKILILISK